MSCIPCMLTHQVYEKVICGALIQLLFLKFVCSHYFYYLSLPRNGIKCTEPSLSYDL